MLVVPLVMLSMVMGITGLGDVRHIGSIGWRTILFYSVTTGLSVLAGLILVNIVQPGSGMSRGEDHAGVAYTIDAQDNRTVHFPAGSWEKNKPENYVGKYVLVLPEQNVRGTIASVTDSSATVKLWEDKDASGVTYITSDSGTRLPFRRVNGQLVSAEPTVTDGTGFAIELPVSSRVQGKEGRNVVNAVRDVVLDMVPTNVFDSMAKMDVLPLIVFSLLLGAVLTVLGERGRPAIEVVSSLNDAIMRLVQWVMIVAPVGIFGLLAGRIGSEGGFDGMLPELMAVGKYSLTVVIGLAIHGFITLPLILAFVGRRNPLHYVRGMSTALLNAFSTASSSATLPLTMNGCEQNNGISNRTSSFVLPLGATINMDGTALYEAVAVMFIAQVYGIEMGPVQQIVVFLTATLAAIGAAGIPEAGLVTMVIVLNAVGLPIEGITLILAVDWLLDRFRTTVNVWGDAIGAGVIDTYERGSSRASVS